MMEKGSFHSSHQPTLQQKSPAQALEDAVKKIPLPNQLPKGVDFADLPASLLKSATLESLIRQNEDLMARLSVSLRKANALEERSAVLESENAGLREKFEIMREQLLVLHEKDKIAGACRQELLNENGDYKGKLQKLERVYSELLGQARAFQRRLTKIERYRARIQKAAPAIQARAKRCLEIEAEYAQFKKEHETSQAQTMTLYEAKLTEAREMLEIYSKKAKERDQIFEDKVKAENEAVFEKRQTAILREEMQEKIVTLGNENGDLRMQLKESLLIQESQRKDLEVMNTDLPELRREIENRREQVESLQALWSHKQRELDHAEEKNQSLQNLNQSLSVNLNQQRKEIQTLQTELEKERFNSQEKIKNLLAEIQMLRIQQAEG